MERTVYREGAGPVIVTAMPYVRLAHARRIITGAAVAVTRRGRSRRPSGIKRRIGGERNGTEQQQVRRRRRGANTTDSSGVGTAGSDTCVAPESAYSTGTRRDSLHRNTTA